MSDDTPKGATLLTKWRFLSAIYDDPELHALSMMCFSRYRDGYFASHPEEQPSCPKADAEWERMMRGDPEPFGEEFQERFLSTLLNDAKFRRAVQVALRGPQ